MIERMINFDHFSSWYQVENLLKIADYGPSDDSEKLVLNEKDAE